MSLREWMVASTERSEGDLLPVFTSNIFSSFCYRVTASMDPTIILLLIAFVAILLVIFGKRDGKCGSCAPESFMPIANLSATQQTAARNAIGHLGRMIQYGEDPEDLDGVDPEQIVMVASPDVSCDNANQWMLHRENYENPIIEGFNALIPSSEMTPNKQIQQWYYDYSYPVMANLKDVSKGTLGGAITSNWWVGTRMVNGLFPPGMWKKWNGKYMYLSNTGGNTIDKNGPLS